MSAIVELKNVTKTIRKKKIIDNLNFTIHSGEVFGLLGPNGAGKTTTIRMMVGLISMTAGEIIICGKSVQKDFEQAIREVGAIVENPELYKFLTGFQNLQQAARLIPGVTKADMNEAIELVGLKERIHDKVKTYSLGMRQRLGIAASILHKPKVLILDEPTNGLDPAGIREIRDYLRKLAQEKNMAVIVSSHLLSEMEMMCDRIAIIQKGKLINIQHVQGEEAEVQSLKYACSVEEVEKAYTILENDGFNPIRNREVIELILEKHQMPLVIKKLVENGISIYEVKAVKISLEDRFLEITNNSEVENYA